MGHVFFSARAGPARTGAIPHDCLSASWRFIVKRVFQAVVCMMILSVCAGFEMTAHAVDNLPFADEAYSVTYEGAVDGQDYVVIAVKAGTEFNALLSADNIMYINQATAANGEVSFTNIRPKYDVPCDVYLGGEGVSTANGPLAIGKLEGHGVTIIGTVTSHTDETRLSDPLTLTLKLKSDGSAVSSQEGTGNSYDYSFSGVAAGTYLLEVSKANHVTRTFEIEVDGQGEVKTDAKIFLLGDVNQNGTVNIVDVSRLLKHVNHSELLDDLTPGYINSDSNVNIVDVSRLLKHVNKTEPLYQWTTLP